MGKQAMMYVFDRVTGRPVWPIEERPVEKGTVPKEWYSPTQPFPTKPAPYDHQGVTLDALIDFTPELRAEAVRNVAKYKLGPIFTPPVVSREEGPVASFRSSGGTNWPGASFDPDTHIAYVPSSTSFPTIGLLPPPSREFSDVDLVQGTVIGGVRYVAGPGENAGADAPPPSAGRGGAAPAAARGRAGAAGANAPPGATGPLAVEGGTAASLGPQGLPLLKPPYGRITAIDMDKGEFIWQIAHGETPDSVRNHPALKGLNIPRTGQPGSVGALVTKTLLIVGEPQVTTTTEHPRGAMLRAYDKTSGKEVGAVHLPAPQSGTPMTYLRNNKQYVVVPVSGGNYSGEYLAFRLP
jgi:quinoprotein glucose dehydrogenase